MNDVVKPKAANTPKPPKKLVPRVAPAVEVAQPAAAVEPAAVAKAAPTAAAKGPVRRPKAVTAKPAAPAAGAKPAKAAKAPKAAASVDAAPEKAAKVSKPVIPSRPAKVAKVAKAEKPAKPRKIKLVRDGFAMPEGEYAQIADLKKRLAAQGVLVKKSELLRAGIALLVAQSDVELKRVLATVERVKTGRPAK